jgi:quercetin 2,3-dioxygenase
MEIITYVREGAVTHKDSLGNEGRTEAGNIHVISAGAGEDGSSIRRASQLMASIHVYADPGLKDAPLRRYHARPVRTSDPMSARSPCLLCRI